MNPLIDTAIELELTAQRAEGIRADLTTKINTTDNREAQRRLMALWQQSDRLARAARRDALYLRAVVAETDAAK